LRDRLLIFTPLRPGTPLFLAAVNPGSIKGFPPFKGPTVFFGPIIHCGFSMLLEGPAPEGQTSENRSPEAGFKCASSRKSARKGEYPGMSWTAG
jgi:hypothetical protein